MMPFTEEDLKRIEDEAREALPLRHLAESEPLTAEIRRCWGRITELIEANNREVEKRRAAEIALDVEQRALTQMKYALRRAWHKVKAGQTSTGSSTNDPA